MRDLAVCARVSKAWNRIVTPELWSVLGIMHDECELFQRDEAQHALVRNACHVRQLRLTMYNLVLYNSIFPEQRDDASEIKPRPHFTNLQKLSVDGYLPSCHQTVAFLKSMQQDIVGLVRQNPGLTDLTFGFFPPSPALVLEAVHHAPGLRELYVRPEFSPAYAKRVLGALPESIEKVIISTDNGDPVDGTELEDIKLQPHPALKLLFVDGDAGGDVLLPFLHTCSSTLTNFSTMGIRAFREERCRVALANLGIFLVSLSGNELPQREVSTDSEIAATISLSCHLENINLHRCKLAGRLTVAAILDNCERLERLNLSGCGGLQDSRIRSKDLQAILCRAPNLQRFDAIDTFATDEFNVFLEAEDMIGSEWATTSMTEFHCKIKVRRPEQHKYPGRPEHDLDTAELRESRALQRQVYARLATQKQLQELHLHQKLYSTAAQSHHQWDSLEMTLESGLGDLAGLKDMKALGVQGIDHRICKAELEWMRTHWTRLDWIWGLFQEFQYPVPGNEKWIARNKPNWVSPYDRPKKKLWWYSIPPEVEEENGSEESESSTLSDYDEEGYGVGLGHSEDSDEDGNDTY